jgi:hypothetical protein
MHSSPRSGSLYLQPSLHRQVQMFQTTMLRKMSRAPRLRFRSSRAKLQLLFSCTTPHFVLSFVLPVCASSVICCITTVHVQCLSASTMSPFVHLASSFVCPSFVHSSSVSVDHIFDLSLKFLKVKQMDGKIFLLDQ